MFTKPKNRLVDFLDKNYFGIFLSANDKDFSDELLFSLLLNLRNNHQYLSVNNVSSVSTVPLMSIRAKRGRPVYINIISVD